MTTDQAIPERSAPSTTLNGALPSLDTPLPAPEVLARLDTASRRGRLAGFERGHAGFFSVLAFGDPFDHRLDASSTPAPGGTRLTFALRLPPKVPAIIAFVVAITIWPGVWLTHSMLVTYFSWYQITLTQTCLWYLPLTIVPLPWLWRRLMHKTRRAAAESAAEQIEKIAREIEGQVRWNGDVGPARDRAHGAPGA